MRTESNLDRELLASYAPVLRFSGGENFHPMNIEDFVSGDTRLYRKSQKDRFYKPSVEWDRELDPQKRLAMLGEIDEKDVFLRYVKADRGSFITRVILTIELILFCLLAAYGVTKLSALYEFVGLDNTDGFKLFLLALMIITWPFIDANGKPHFGILLALFGILFFGTPFIVGFAALALGQLAGFWMVYVGFSLWYRPLTRFSRNWGLPILHGLNLLLIGLTNVLIGYWLDWQAHVRSLATGYWYELPAILAASTALFYGLVLFSNYFRTKHSVENVRPQEIFTGWIFGIALFVCAGLLWAGRTTSWLSPVGLCVSILFLFGAVVLWYLLDPIQVTSPGPLFENNDRQMSFGWDRRMLLWVTVTLAVYLIVSGLVYTHDYNDINDYLFATIIHFLISSGLILVTLGLLGDSIPGYFLDVLSSIYNVDALRAKRKYREAVTRRTRRDDAMIRRRYWYYGRVVRQREWTVLQYNYFYAFNDFRSTAGGMNNHEGDWECVNIYLCGDIDSHSHSNSGEAHLQPFGVAYSQHHDGVFQFWEDVPKAKTPQRLPSDHPIVYAALGSHAGFPHPEIYPLSMQFSGTAQRLVGRLESFIQSFRSGSRLVETHIREVELAFDRYERERGSLIAQGGKSQGGSLEYAAGDGIRVGYGYDPALKFYGDELKIVLNPPLAVERRESNFDGEPANKEKDIFEDWAFEVIDDNTPWTRYKGLWGRHSPVSGEGGPQGPRWAGEKIRIRWGDAENALEWLDVLLLDILSDDNKPVGMRKQALQYLSKQTPLFSRESYGAE